MSQVYVSRILQSSKVLASQSRIEFFILACIICEGQGYTTAGIQTACIAKKTFRPRRTIKEKYIRFFIRHGSQTWSLYWIKRVISIRVDRCEFFSQLFKLNLINKQTREIYYVCAE